MKCVWKQVLPVLSVRFEVGVSLLIHLPELMKEAPRLLFLQWKMQEYSRLFVGEYPLEFRWEPALTESTDYMNYDIILISFCSRQLCTGYVFATTGAVAVALGLNHLTKARCMCTCIYEQH